MAKEEKIKKFNRISGSFKSDDLKIKKFLLEIPEDIWNKWKDSVPRSLTLNKALIKLLKEEAEK